MFSLVVLKIILKLSRNVISIEKAVNENMSLMSIVKIVQVVRGVIML